MQTASSTPIQTVLRTIQDRWGSEAIFVAREEMRTQLAGSLHLGDEHASQHAALAPLAPYIARGQLVEISGAPHSGKSSLALSLLATLLPARGLATYVDSPGTFYPPSVAASGVDLRRLWVVRLHEWPAMLAATEMLLGSGVVDVVLWDLVGRHEVLTSGQLRRLQRAASSHNATLLILTAQSARPLHQALDYGAAVRLLVRRRDLLWEQLGRQRLLNGYRLHVEVTRAPGKRYVKPLDLIVGNNEPAARALPLAS